MKIQLKDPQTLRPHPALKALPQLADDDTEFHRLCESVLAHGAILDPIKATADGRIVDGRHRWRAARQCQLATVPVIEVGEEEAATIALECLLRRRHLTPGQRAYLAQPLFAPAFEEARKHHLDCLKKGENSPVRNSVSDGKKSPDEWAEHVGVSRLLLQQANKLRQFFYSEPFDKAPFSFSLKSGGVEKGVKMTLREYFEPRILDPEDPMGLGRALEGIGMKLKELDDAQRGKKHAGGPPEEIVRQLELWEEGCGTLKKRLGYWQNWAEPQRREAKAALGDLVLALPDDLLPALVQTARRELKRRKHTGEIRPGKERNDE